MHKLIRFFFTYNIKTWKRNKIQFFFNMLGISISIAIVLAIQILSIYNISSVKESSKVINGGDISIIPNNNVISDYQSNELQLLQEKGEIEFTQSVWNSTSISFNGKSTNIILRFIDINKYPIYQDKKNTENFKLELNEENSIVLSENIAIRIGAEKNDKIEIFNKYRGDKEAFTIKKIVKSDGETGLDMNVFGYALLNSSVLDKFVPSNSTINKIYIKVNDETNVNDTSEKLKQVFNYGQTKTYEDVFLETQKQIESTRKGLMLIGILTFFIAGISIANTMVLSILKRQRELSILKVLGMKNVQLPFFMVAETSIMAIISNIIGIPLGFTLSTVINHILYSTWIDFKEISNIIAPIFYIFITSIFISIIFTFIPALISSKIRANTLLREQNISLEKKINLGEPILICAIILGGIFSIYLKSFVGFLYVFGILIVGGSLYIISTIILKVFSKIPTSKNKIAIFTFRNLGRQYKKISLMMVTLVIGVSSVGITINISNSILPSLQETVKNQFGYNLLLTTSMDDSNKVEKELNSEKGILGFTQSLRSETFFKYINGVNKEAEFKENMSKEQYKNKLGHLLIEGLKFDRNIIKGEVKEGRWLEESDQGKNSAVINEELAESMGINVGDNIGVLIDGKEVTYNVVGIKNKTIINTSQITTTFDTLKTNTNWNSVVYYTNVQDENLEENIKIFNKNLDRAFILNINDLLPELNKTINNQAKLFSFISIFCIVSSIFLIANMTLITFFDRIKEFTLIKILGAKSNVITSIIIIESVLIGCVGGLISVLINEIITYTIFKLVLKINFVINYITIVGMIALSIIVVCISAMLVIPQVKVKQLNILLRSE